MKNAPDTVQVTAQQIKRFVHGFGRASLTEAKQDIERELGHETDVTGWGIWEAKGLRSSDMASPVAKAIADLVTAYEEGTLILSPLQVRSWREGMGVSQPEAAEYLGVSRSTWSRWEQTGIVDHFAGTAAYALAASATAKDSMLVEERAQAIRKILGMEITLGRSHLTPIQQAIAISTWGGQGYYARLGIGSFGLYQLLRDAWDTRVCASCMAKIPMDARFCSNCGSAMAPGKEGTMP